MLKYVFANMKMNQTRSQTDDYIKHFLQIKTKDDKVVGFAFPFLSLSVAKKLFSETKILVGAQNVSSELKGSYTGETSAEMLFDVGINFCLVGHSERRKNFYESGEKINKKIKNALQFGLKVLLCIGESKIERQSGQTNTVLKKQLEDALLGLYENELNNIFVVYEPIWAIGTGEVATTKQISQTLENIREIIASLFSSNVIVNVLYGGSVNAENIKNISQTKGVDGVLVGGAALDPDSFAKIINV